MTIRPTNAALLRPMLPAIADVADLVLKRTWTLVVFPTPCLFAGEDPVVHINPTGESHGYGVVTAEQLYMPISTTHALLLSHPWAGWPEGLVDGTAELARRLNWTMLNQPSNRELLLHRMCRSTRSPRRPSSHWPWGDDPDSATPIYMHYLTARHTPARARPSTRRADLDYLELGGGAF